MSNEKRFKTGNKIIEDGKVYVIYEIEKFDVNKSNDRTIHYRPYYLKPSNHSVTCTIPEKNLPDNSIREPVSSAELDTILSYLSQESGEDSVTVELLEATEYLNLNSIFETARVLKQCIFKQKSGGEDFNLAKKGILKIAVGMMLEEMAFVYNITEDQAFDKLKLASEKYYSEI